MTICLIVFKSLRHHALSTLVTAFCIALAGGLLMSVWAVKAQSQATFTGVNAGFDAVLGARGSKLQLVLNAIFHLESSPGNLAWSDYLEIQKNPNVALAVPLAVGDNFHPYHGLIFDEKNQHSETYLVVGLLEPSNTPADRVIWIPVEGVQKMT